MRGRHVLFLCLLLVFGTSMTGAAQSTPAAGDEYSFTDAEGETLGLITVEEIEDPFTGYAEGYEPEEDTRYVLLRAAFEATGESVFDANPNSLLLRDTDGFLWGPTSINREDTSLPDLQSQSLAPGNRVSGAVTFTVPEQAELVEVLYQPESGRLITLAGVQEDPEPLPVLGDEISYESAEAQGSAALITVMEVEDPFEDYAEGYEPGEDTRYVAATITFESLGETVFDAQPNEVLLRDSDGFVWAATSITRGEDLVQPNLEAQPLAPGNYISGVVGFQIPEDAELDRLLYQPESGRLIVLADLQADTGKLQETS